ncbi:transcriptional regulator NosR [Plasticicumulans sp.]|uniref:transcriptional regulator NosR n=1 Tax=Plasticicumulans sp. TaxID=2307179 RepID=UPI0039215880
MSFAEFRLLCLPVLRSLSALLLLVACGVAPAAPAAAPWELGRGWFPGADRVAPADGTPPAAAVYRGSELLGYLFQTDQVERIPAYSGKPVNTLVGIDRSGRISGAQVLEHHEPILLVGIPETRLGEFIAQYVGKRVTDRVKVGAANREGYVGVDAITGATVTVMVINEGIMRSAHRVAVARGLIGEAAAVQRAPARVKADVYAPADWQQLSGDGSVRTLRLTRADVQRAFDNTAAAGVERPTPEQLDEPFVELAWAYLNPPTIGRSLLGDAAYARLMAGLAPGEHAIAVLGNGYSFKGSGYVRGGIFDRVQLRQNDQAISFRDSDFQRLSDVYAPGMPRFREMVIFFIREHYHFDPGTPWQLELLVRRQTGPLDSVFTSFSGGYETPARYLELPAAPLPAPAAPGSSTTGAPQAAVTAAADATALAPMEPIWKAVWRERGFRIAVLGAGLTLLTLILLFQDVLVTRPRLLPWLRNGFLLWTLLFIGWYGLAQLSVVNVLTFTNALIAGFRWDTFLIDPMMFILWGFVAATLLLWGRGVYCGWLCPFGALQELVNELALKLGIRQWRLPFAVHERLWAVKYLILLGLFAVSLQSLGEAEQLAEIEPFKTAITLRFVREWGFVAWALGLVLVSAVNRKFYCRYLCPLGAALAIPARLRLFDWLKRRRECGKPCQICAEECEVQAIHPTGQINANECHYCLDCQVTYFDDGKCPPLVDKRRKRDKAAALAAGREVGREAGAPAAAFDGPRRFVRPPAP